MRRFTTILIIFATSLLILSSCKTKQPTVTNSTVQGEELYFLSKGPCFGRCPVFSMTVYDNGLAKYKGTNFTKMLGTYEKTITAEEMAQLAQLFKASEFAAFDTRYESLLPDLPLVKVGYADGDSMRIVMGKETRPASLVTLQNALDNIANQDNWTMIEPLQVDDAPAEDMIVDNLDKAHIIIKHKSGTQIPMWFNDARGAYGIRIVDQVADQPGAWLITYTTSKFSPEEVMEALQSDPVITSAEFLKVNK